MLNKNLVHLSKFMSLVLRHDPDAAGINLDVNGSTDLDDFIKSIQAQPNFHWVTLDDIQTVVREGSKPRFEIIDNKIRAKWGHSTAERIKYQPAKPPAELFHGTSRKVVPIILKDGLLSMTRQYVHLSADVETAELVGRRQDRSPVVFKIRALEARANGVNFYGPDPTIWLATAVPAKYIEIYKRG